MYIALIVVNLILGTPAAAAKGQPPVAQEPSVQLPPELARVLADYETAWRGRDPAAPAPLFAGGGVGLPNGHPPGRPRRAGPPPDARAGGALPLWSCPLAT